MGLPHPADLLQRTAQSPRSLFDDSNGCSLIVLACHCFLVHDGFKVLGAGTSCWNRYAPPAKWSENDMYWCLKYSHHALKNDFILEAHRQGKQLLVRVIEDNPKASTSGDSLNVKMLGLNADVYVPDPEALWQAKGWHKAISAEACSRLAVLWEQSVREPMLATVDRHPSYPPSADIFRPPVAGDRTTKELVMWGVIGGCALLTMCGVVWAVSNTSSSGASARASSRNK